VENFKLELSKASFKMDKDVIAYVIYINSQKIGLLQSMIESYEGIGIVRTLDESKGLLSVLASNNHKEIVLSVLEELRIALSIVPAPLPEEEYSRYLLNT